MENQAKQDETPQIFGIIGFVIAILSFVFSIIPCIGFYAFIPALLATVFSFIAYRKQKIAVQASGLSLAGTIIGIVAIGVACYQYVQFSEVFKATNKMNEKLDHLIIDAALDSLEKHQKMDSIQMELKDSIE